MFLNLISFLFPHPNQTLALGKATTIDQLRNPGFHSPSTHACSDATLLLETPVIAQKILVGHTYVKRRLPPQNASE